MTGLPGGTIEYVPSDVGADISLDSCEYTDDLSMTGTGSLDFETGEFILEITLPLGDLVYENDGESATVTGTYEGESISRDRVSSLRPQFDPKPRRV